MCRLFHLHQLITRTSRSYSYCAFPFQMTLRWERLYLQTIGRNLSSVGRSDFGSVSRRDRWYWSSGGSGVLGALRIMPLFIGRCSKIISSCILDWQVCRLADHDPYSLAAVLTFQIVDSDLLDDVGAGPAQYISVDYGSDQPSLHVQEHLQFRRLHEFPARLRARRSSR